MCRLERDRWPAVVVRRSPRNSAIHRGFPSVQPRSPKPDIYRPVSRHWLTGSSNFRRESVAERSKRPHDARTPLPDGHPPDSKPEILFPLRAHCTRLRLAAKQAVTPCWGLGTAYSVPRTLALALTACPRLYAPTELTLRARHALFLLLPTHPDNPNSSQSG